MTINHSLDATAERLPVGRDDPILQELWQVKAKINSEANYDVAVLAAQARALDVDELQPPLGWRCRETSFFCGCGLMQDICQMEFKYLCDETPIAPHERK